MDIIKQESLSKSLCPIDFSEKEISPGHQCLPWLASDMTDMTIKGGWICVVGLNDNFDCEQPESFQGGKMMQCAVVKESFSSQ